MKTFIFLLTTILCSINTSCKEQKTTDTLATYTPTPRQLTTKRTAPDTKNIQVALLLDTSNSMDGLINQAKAQLWKIVNELSYAKCGTSKIKLQIALYEYGNDALNAREGFIRQVLPFSDDLDEISQQLFALRTNGGNEFCGKVIATSLRQLNWKKETDHLKLIFIAGNESFTQGSINYKDATTDAVEKDITVNTIFCGAYNQGITAHWKDGAIRTGGEYSAIDHTIATRHMDTPYDDEILKWNKKLNNTYVQYGSKGMQKMKMQAAQDVNAQSHSKGNAVSRAISKSSNFYTNKSWDLVDAVAEVDEEEIEDVIKNIKPTALSEELQDKSPSALKQHITIKKNERLAIHKEIKNLQALRNKYIAQNSKKEEGNLEKSLINAIKIQGKKKSFQWNEYE